MANYEYPRQQPPYPTTNNGGMPAPPAYAPSTTGNEFASSPFDDKSVRRAFIRKVYLILSLQMVITVGIVCIFTFVPAIKEYVQKNIWLYIMAYIVFFVTYIVLACCVQCRRNYPANYICLAVFTVALSIVAGAIAAFHNTEAVLIALSMSALLCIGLTLFAIQTRWDFTKCTGLIVALSLVLFLTGIACLIVYFVSGRNRVLQAVYAGIALMLFSVMLVMDTQSVVGGRKHELDEDEYIFGALQIYVDVVFIFMAILGIAGSVK